MGQRPVWNKQSYVSALSLAALLPQPPGQIWLAGPQSSSSRCLERRAQRGQPPVALPSPGQKAVAYPDTHAAFFLLVKHSWAAGFSYRSSMRDTVNSRSITTLRYDNPTWLEMLYFIWRGINNRRFACNWSSAQLQYGIWSSKKEIDLLFWKLFRKYQIKTNFKDFAICSRSSYKQKDLFSIYSLSKLCY